MRGRFIALEGGEGSGKSTQARRLAERLGATPTFEPGDTELGRALRTLVLDPGGGPISARAEALLMAADRAQHVDQLVRPTLEAGRDVVTDRYAASSVAYQGHGRGLDPAEVEHLSHWASGGLWPDLVVLLDVDVEVAATRVGDEPDRLEAAGVEFHRRVRAGFLAQAAADPGRWAVVDATGDPDAVAGSVWRAVVARWPEPAG
ncbi:MAG: dTMP kinase [Acidimicrobiia bacterium]